MTPELCIITGPTATGKTRLAIALAQKLNGEIISADSMQIYRGMDIGTAKPSLTEMDGVPHHMLDVADPWEDYSVACYVEEATAVIIDVLSRGKRPFVVGGTGLYIDSLVSGRHFAAGDPRVREELSARYDAEGGRALIKELEAFDPESAARLHPSDKKRVIRAIEVHRVSGLTMTEHNRRTQTAPPRYRAKKLALNYENRADLYAAIDARVDGMLESGLLAEVSGLLARGISPKATAMQAIGYKELVGHLEDEASLEESVAHIKQESRRYAKRQLSWLRRDEDLRWLLWEKSPSFANALPISTEFFRSFDIIGSEPARDEKGS